MSTEENKALFRRWHEEVVSRGELERVGEFVAPDMIDHAAPPGVPPGPEGVKQLLTMYRTAFPDLEVTIEDLIAEGDKVVARITSRATHRGEFMGTAPTGKQVTTTAFDMVRIEDGTFVEHWVEADFLGVLQQLGTTPAAGQPPHADQATGAAGGFIRAAGEAGKVQALGETAALPAEGADTGGVLAAHEVVVPPGSARPPKLHRTYDEALYVLEGEVTLVVGDRSVTAAAGSFGFAPRGTPHAVQNPGTAPARVLTVTTPADDVRALVDELNALPPGPPDMARIGAILTMHDIHPAGPPPGQSGYPR